MLKRINRAEGKNMYKMIDKYKRSGSVYTSRGIRLKFVKNVAGGLIDYGKYEFRYEN
jgi:hypothetical protein